MAYLYNITYINTFSTIIISCERSICSKQVSKDIFLCLWQRKDFDEYSSG